MQDVCYKLIIHITSPKIHVHSTVTE